MAVVTENPSVHKQRFIEMAGMLGNKFENVIILICDRLKVGWPQEVNDYAESPGKKDTKMNRCDTDRPDNNNILKPIKLVFTCDNLISSNKLSKTYLVQRYFLYDRFTG